MPEIKPLDLEKKDGKVLQPKLPFRSLPFNLVSIGPSGSGKSLTIIRSMTDRKLLGGMFQRYLLFSPNIFVDPQYKFLISYIEETTGQKQEDFCFDTFEQDEVRKLMEDQKKTNTYLRKIGSKRLLQPRFSLTISARIIMWSRRIILS
jgi:GTPase SAR1 family protein